MRGIVFCIVFRDVFMYTRNERVASILYTHAYIDTTSRVIAPFGTRTRICHSRVRCFAGLSIPGRDIDFLSCSVFICALRSVYSALNSIPLVHYTRI